MTVTIETQETSKVPDALKVAHKMKVAKKALSCQKVVEQLKDRAN